MKLREKEFKKVKIKNPRPNKDEGGISRVTTLIRILFTQSASVSLRQDLSRDNVRHSVAVY